MVPQCFGYVKGSWNIPTPAQERSMTYQALIEGANGLVWYAYDDVQFKVLDHSELWGMMKQLTREIKILTPILLEPAGDGQRFAAGPDNCVRGVSIQLGRELTVLMAHTNEKDLGQQEVGAPALPATGKADVMFEDRSVDVVDGKIQDAFAPYAVHVYRLKR
jgi:ligand-binding sensor domain-containing protein